ncbi:hypothetical protein OAS86_07275, partial [Gammaproteobacteria bacterium]|nr:hypothetical protein [Gammaproteobacteria bacterium]
LLCASGTASAQQFSVAVGPPRLELQTANGELIRESLTLQNFGMAPSTYKVYTSEWRLEEDGSQHFDQELAQNSCRPWVSIERREITVLGRTKRPFRLEIRVPADAPLEQCRFAILFEGTEAIEGPQLNNGVSLPVTGRLAVIVYLTPKGARADLAFNRVDRADDGSLKLVLINNGRAHARLDGYLNAQDQDGTRYEARMSTLPILPQQQRFLPLTLFKPSSDQRVADPAWPLRVWGDILWSHGTITVDETLEAQ